MSKVEVLKNNYQILTLKPEEIFTFPQGLAGFERIKRYCLLYNKEEEPFYQLQALDNYNLFFYVVSPWKVLPTYDPEIDEAELEFIGNPPLEKLIVLCLVVLNEKDYTQSTVNLAAPLLINPLNGIGKQTVILNLNEYSYRYKILQSK